PLPGTNLLEARRSLPDTFLDSVMKQRRNKQRRFRRGRPHIPAGSMSTRRKELMNSSPVTASSSTTQTATQTSSNNSLGGGMDSMFMQLLITQLQNQDPLSPMDPSTFVNQILQSTFGSSNTANAGGQ